MFKKKVVTLFFSPTKLLAVELSSNKKRLLKSIEVDLPESIIKNYRIADVPGCAEIVRTLWSKAGFKEKSLGIVIPEFSTFTKLLKLPKLSVLELDEAVRWQVQDYLPTSLDRMIVDWKIVERTKDGIETLVVAVPKDVLEGYISVCEQAGLFPLVVETPSLGLMRLAKEENGGKLIVYRNFGEQTVVLASGENILSTLVVHGESEAELVDKAKKLISRFDEVKVGKVFLGGLISESLATDLSKAAGKEVVIMQPKISGADAAKVQQCLLPIAMQLGGVTAPSDPDTLNLLPFGLVEKYNRAKLKVQIWSLTLTITLFVWVSFLSVLGAYLFLNQMISNAGDSAPVTPETQKKQDLIEEVKWANEVSQRVLKIKNAYVSPAVIFNAISDAKPESISITSYDIDLDKGVVGLIGISSNRATLVDFKRRLEETDDFINVALPISSFEEETDLEFSLSFDYRPIAEKSTQKGGVSGRSNK